MRMKSEDRFLGLHELMKVAAKTDTLVRQAWEESKADRITGRLARDPNDFGALCFAIVEGVKNADAFSFEITGGQNDWLLLQISMMQLSYPMWKDFCNDTHPDLLGGQCPGKLFLL